MLAAVLFASRIHSNPKLKPLNAEVVFLVPITTISSEPINSINWQMLEEEVKTLNNLFLQKGKLGGQAVT